MKKITEWLDLTKEKTGSDYKTAKALGVTRQMVSKMRSGTTTPSVKVCVKMAEILDVSPLQIIASCEVEKDPSEEKHWLKWVGAAAILAGVIMIDSPSNSMAYAGELTETSYTLCAVAVSALILFIAYTSSFKRFQKGCYERW